MQINFYTEAETEYVMRIGQNKYDFEESVGHSRKIKHHQVFSIIQTKAKIYLQTLFA